MIRELTLRLLCSATHMLFAKCHTFNVLLIRHAFGSNPLGHLLGNRESGVSSCFTGLKGALETEGVVDAFDTVRGVDVLDKGDLVASCATLAGDDGAVGEEVFPDLTRVSKTV